MKTLEKITSLEAQLSRAVAGAPAALEAIVKRQAHAESVIESFANDPAPEKLDKVFAAHAALATGRELLARFGDLKSWQARLESAWITSHQVELVALLEGVVNERAAHREAYLESTAVELGRLTTELARADAGNAPDGELVRLNDRLAALEDDRARRESSLRAAANAVKGFARATERVNAYQPLYAHWHHAKDSVKALNFELISEAVSPKKT